MLNVQSIVAHKNSASSCACQRYYTVASAKKKQKTTVSVSSIFDPRCWLISLTRMNQGVFSWDCAFGVRHGSQELAILHPVVCVLQSMNQYSKRRSTTHIWQQKNSPTERRRRVSNLYTYFGTSDSNHFTPVQTKHAHGEVLFAVGVTGSQAKLLIGACEILWQLLNPTIAQSVHGYLHLLEK